MLRILFQKLGVFSLCNVMDNSKLTELMNFKINIQNKPRNRLWRVQSMAITMRNAT